MAIVNIPDVGRVRFPDEMDRDAIEKAINEDIMPSVQPSISHAAVPAPGQRAVASGELAKDAVTAGQPPAPEERAAEIPPMTMEEGERALFASPVHVPRVGKEGSGLRGVSEMVGGAVEGAASVGGLLTVAGLATPARAVIGPVLTAAMAKQAAEKAGEASVTGSPQTIAEAATAGVGALLGAADLPRSAAALDAVPAVARETISPTPRDIVNQLSTAEGRAKFEKFASKYEREVAAQEVVPAARRLGSREEVKTDASKVIETAAKDGTVPRVVPEDGPAGGGVPQPEGGAGVRAQAQGGVPVAAEAGAPAEGPQGPGPGAAHTSAFPTGDPIWVRAWNAITSPVKAAADTARNLWRNGEVREAITYGRDKVDNAANIAGRTAANDIEGELRRAFPKVDADLVQRALTMVVESGLDRDVLRDMHVKVETSTAAHPATRKAALDAIDFAIYRMDELAPMARDYGRLTSAQVASEHAVGIPTLERANYVMHAQEMENEGGLLSGEAGNEGAGFRKVRQHATFADSIAAGVEPRSLSATQLLQARVAAGQRLVGKRQWVEAMRTMTDADGNPIATAPQIVTRADGTTYPTAPRGYSMEQLGGQPIAVRQGFEGLISALTDPSAFSKSAPGRSLMSAAGTTKSASLMFDLFHMNRIAFWDALIKGLGVRTFRIPIPSYRKGVTLLDTSAAELAKMAAAGEIPAKWLANLTEDQRQLGLAVKTGYNVGRISDSMHQDAVHSLPFIGTYNKWLFDQFQRGAMAESWLLEFKRRRMARPGETELETAREVSRDLNTRFGSLGRQGVLKSKSAQDAARLIMLAPQWNEGLVRSEVGAAVQAGRFAIDTAKGERLYAGVLLRSVGGMAVAQFVANQLINYITRGQPTWENKEEGVGAKLSAWVPDIIGEGPGFFLHPLGLAAETMHLLMKGMERTDDFRATLESYLRSRASVAMRPVLTFMTNTDFLGRKLKPGTVWGEMAKAAVPVPIGAGPAFGAAKSAVTGERQEAFAGQFQKQLMATGGVKVDQAPSAEQWIATLAREYNRTKGVQPQGEFYAGDYQPLVQALRVGNAPAARDAADALLKTKSAEDIAKHFERWPADPFTHSGRREAQFRRELSPEQREAYDKARSERRGVAKEAMRAVREAQRAARAR